MGRNTQEGMNDHMLRFPKREADVVALADAMIAGYTANTGIFPNDDFAVLQTVRDAYQAGKNAQLDAQAQVGRRPSKPKPRSPASHAEGQSVPSNKAVVVL